VDNVADYTGADVSGVNLGPGNGLAYDGSRHLARALVFQGAAVITDRGAHSAQYYYFTFVTHRFSSFDVEL
jgi:hypothetical protein